MGSGWLHVMSLFALWSFDCQQGGKVSNQNQRESSLLSLLLKLYLFTDPTFSSRKSCLGEPKHWALLTTFQSPSFSLWPCTSLVASDSIPFHSFPILSIEGRFLILNPLWASPPSPAFKSVFLRFILSTLVSHYSPCHTPEFFSGGPGFTTALTWKEVSQPRLLTKRLSSLAWVIPIP